MEAVVLDLSEYIGWQLETKFMKKYFLGFIIIIAVVSAGVFIFKKGESVSTISPDILVLTAPVLSFSGIIEKMDSSSMTVSKKSDQGNLTYQVKFNDKTPVQRAAPPTSSPSASLTTKDLKAGQAVIAASQQDLRIITNRQIEAISLTIASLYLNGTITKIEGTEVTVKGIVGNFGIPLNSIPVAKEYVITVDSSLNLKAGVNMTAFFDSEIRPGVKASFIQIIPVVPPGSAITLPK